MLIWRRISVFRFLALLLCLFAASPAGAAPVMKIGVLPAGDSLIIHAAAEDGFFAAHGLNVEPVPFQSALELGAAMRAGTLDGHFGDIINVLMQNESGSPQRIIATTSRAGQGARFFGLVISPKAEVKSLEELQGTETATASATIVDYLLTRILREKGLPDDHFARQEIRQIPIRLQMLSAGQIGSAFLPEPLVSLLEKRGASVLLDDTVLKDALAVIALRREVTDAPGGAETVKAFRRALADTARAINGDPEKYREMMIRKGLLSKETGTHYAMLRYEDPCPLGIPSKEDMLRYAGWMEEQKILKAIPAYEDIVWHE
ncbi:MAG: ABC transporter substrate-binding protein [Mailhella sp.]|nr:ABC transporter substrate-binding protein [Mailhella sp.]